MYALSPFIFENQSESKRILIGSLFGAMRGSPVLDEIEKKSRRTRDGAIEGN